MPETDTPNSAGWNRERATTEFPGLDPTMVSYASPLHSAQRYLAAAHDSVSSFIQETYPTLRELRKGSRGRLTHSEQDVFRAAVVFAGAGIDTVFKQALRSCVPIQIDSSEGARKEYLDFVERHITSGPTLSTKRLAALLTAPSSDEALRRAYVEELTGSSLQARNQVTKSLAALGLHAETDLFKDAKNLDLLFRTRNEIAHEMDMLPSAVRGRGKRSRHDRGVHKYIDMCHTGLNYCQRVLNALQTDLDASGN